MRNDNIPMTHPVRTRPVTRTPLKVTAGGTWSFFHRVAFRS